MCKSRACCPAYVILLYTVMGYSHKRICEVTGYKSSAVGNIISRKIGSRAERGHIVREQWVWMNSPHKAVSDMLMPRIIELHEQGLSDYEIASELGIGRYAVNRRLRKAGIHRGKGFTSPRESVCKRCGKTFAATKKNQIYCSETCCNAVCSIRRNDAKRVGVDEVETITLREVWERDHGRCYLCGRKTDWNDYRMVNGWRVTGPRYPSRDHVIALSNGGTHTRDNIRLACFECNTNKNNHGQLRLAV